jgi:hypothetical protein
MSGYVGSKRSSSLVSATEITLDGAKLKSSGDSITKSDGTTAVLSESGGVVTLNNGTIGSGVDFSGIANDSISGDKIDGGTATPATLSGSILSSTKLASSGTSIYKSNGSTAVISESGGTATLNNVTLGGSVVFPTKKLINYFEKVDGGAHSSVGEGFYSPFDTTITALSANSCFKITFTSLYGIPSNNHSASYRIYVQKNGGSDLLCKTAGGQDLIAGFGSFPDTGKLPYFPDSNHAVPISFSHFDYTSHSAGDTMKYKFWFRTQGSDTLLFNQTSSGTNLDHRATGVTSIIIEEYEK